MAIKLVVKSFRNRKKVVNLHFDFSGFIFTEEFPDAEMRQAFEI